VCVNGSKLAPYLSCVTTDVTLIGNKTMKKQTGARMFAQVQRALNVSF
jgi:hypothetical protein